MKTFITSNTQSPTGYAIVVEQDNGQKEVKMIEKTYPNEPFTLVLPENPSNRKYFNSKKVDASNGQIELTYKESKTLGPRDNSQPRKKLEDYLTDEEKATIAEIMEKAKARKEADKPKPLSEIDKARLAAEKAKAKYEALLAKENN